jgi:DNA-binding CsgD family transcriptional regulator
MPANSTLPSPVDLWAPVPFDDLPAGLMDAAARSDWSALKTQLRTVMDSNTTDGAYGRELLQFVMRVPLPSDSVLDRYRASICVDHGDWDGLQRYLASDLIEPIELARIRDIILAPLDRRTPPSSSAEHHRILFELYDCQFQRAVGRFRRWARRMPGFYPEVLWGRDDIPAGRHTRFRRLQDAVLRAVAEAHGGSLPVAQAFAAEAGTLGDDREPQRDVAHDLEILVRHARGGRLEGELTLLKRIASPTGLSPLGSWEVSSNLMPFFAYLDDGSLEWAARLGQQIAMRLGSPRALFQSQSWVAAARIADGKSSDEVGLAGLLAEARGAGPGLRVVPFLLRGLTTHRPEDFRIAESAAREAGNVWAQVTALTWLVALNPQPVTLRWLHRLLESTGWRRPLFVPASVAADAALGLAAAGRRGVSIVELAGVGGRANVTVEVALRHIDDAEAPETSRVAGVDVLGKIGTTHSREILHRLSRRTDGIGLAARRILAKGTLNGTLSGRELEVLDLAGHGLTNRDIAERLSLSPHTIARHLANARAKLGAANRAEAAAKLEEMKV